MSDKYRQISLEIDRGPPTERKKKGLNNVKRVRAKRNQMSLHVDEENDLEKEIETEMDEEPEAQVEKVFSLDNHLLGGMM